MNFSNYKAVEPTLSPPKNTASKGIRDTQNLHYDYGGKDIVTKRSFKTWYKY